VLILVQEEDFVSNLYHRNLLPKVEVEDVQDLLDQAIHYLGQQEEMKTGGFQEALISRLTLRKNFLFCVQQDSALNDSQAWDSCLKELPVLLETKRLGIPVNPAFSAKIQRRLASTIPPRPIVEISFEQTYEELRRTCQYMGEANRLKQYYGGSNLMVCLVKFVSNMGADELVPRHSFGYFNLDPRILRFLSVV
jgi:N-alpha-acetyltransferase 35, NatC auxiliary subunit